MNPWIETIGVVLLAGMGVLAGLGISRLRKPYWLLGFVPPLVLLLAMAAARCAYSLTFVAPMSWLAAGRREFTVSAVAAAVFFSATLARLPRKRVKNLVVIFMIVAVIRLGVLPFLLPAILQGRLARMETVTTVDGICLQQTSYTCGPAAAVTALGRLGVKAEEGELAVLAHTNHASGTPLNLLCEALQDRYGSEGISFEQRRFDSVAELREAGPTIAVIKYAFFVDHYAAVLDVTEDKVILGDPLEGRRELSHEEFEDIWRGWGIVVRRASGDRDAQSPGRRP